MRLAINGLKKTLNFTFQHCPSYKTIGSYILASVMFKIFLAAIICCSVAHCSPDRFNHVLDKENDVLLREQLTKRLFRESAEDDVGSYHKHDPFLIKIAKNTCEKVNIDGTCSVDVNGCGPKILTAILKFVYIPNADLFKPACNKHDICYSCGQHYGWTQKQCDDRFYEETKRICECHYVGFWKSIFKARCHFYSKKYTELLRIFGASNFSKKPGGWCKNSCAKKRGNPKIMGV